MQDVKYFLSWLSKKLRIFVTWGKTNPGQVLQLGLVLYYAFYTGSLTQAGWELGDLAIQVIGKIYGL